MELKEFVSETLTQIIAGVKKAQDKNNGDDLINPKIAIHGDKGNSIAGEVNNRNVVHDVQFDVAVTAIDSDSSKAKIGVVSGIFNAGAEGKTENKNSSVTKIKFTVPIIYPR